MLKQYFENSVIQSEGRAILQNFMKVTGKVNSKNYTSNFLQKQVRKGNQTLGATRNAGEEMLYSNNRFERANSESMDVVQDPDTDPDVNEGLRNLAS